MTDLEKDKILLLAHNLGKMARELQSIKRLLKEIADTPQTETDFWASVTRDDWLKAHGLDADTTQTERSSE